MENSCIDPNSEVKYPVAVAVLTAFGKQADILIVC